MALFLDVILPILLVVGAGAVLERCFDLSVASLSKLVIYLLVPAYLFRRIYASTLTWSETGGILAATALTMVCLGVPLLWGLRRAGLPRATLGAMLLAAIVYNAGNVGIPVAEFFYRSNGAVFPGMKSAADGVAVQAIVLMVSSLSIWMLGYSILSAAKGDGLRGALGFFRLPILYVVVLAFLCRDAGIVVPQPVLSALDLVTGATVPVMLIVLGSQLVKGGRWPRWPRVLPVMGIKLLVMPAVTAGIAWALGLWPWPGAQLVIAAAAPTAVNIVLLNIELDADAGTAADCVFWSTLVSCVTLTLAMHAVLAVAV